MQPTFHTAPHKEREPALLPIADKTAVRQLFSRIGLGLAVLMSVMMLATLAIHYMILKHFPACVGSWWVTWVVSLLPLYLTALPCMYLLLRKIPVTPHNPDYDTPDGQRLAKPRFHFGHWMILLVIGLGCIYLGNQVGRILMGIMSSITKYDYADPLNQVMEQSPLWMIFLGVCICAPLGEEFIFRKLLLDRTRGYGEGASIVLSGLLFGLFHGNLFQFFYAFLLGMILAYIYLRSGKYLWCVAMHAVLNFLGSIAIPAIVALLPTDPEATLTALQVVVALLLNVWVYGLIIAAVVLICLLRRRRKLSEGSLPLGRDGLPIMLVNPGMLVAMGVMAVLLVLNLIPA